MKIKSGFITRKIGDKIVAVAVGEQVVPDGAQRLEIDRVERCVHGKAAAECVVEEQHVREHPHIIVEQQLHIQPAAARTLTVRNAAEHRDAQKNRERRRERELLFRADNDSGRHLIEQVEAQQRRREQRCDAAK